MNEVTTAPQTVNLMDLLKVITGIGKNGKPYTMLVLDKKQTFNQPLIEALVSAGVDTYDLTATK